MEKRLNRWIKTLDDPGKLFYGMVLENETEILDANTSQLEQGKDALGQYLEDYLSDDYARYKRTLSSLPPFGTPDLKLEGDFHEGFVLRWGSNEFFITSTDWKTSKLKQMYGEDIFGLMDESLQELKAMMIETFQKLFRDGLL